MSNVQASIGFFLLSSVCTAIASKQKRKRGKRIHEKYKMSTSDQTRNEIERDFIKLKRLYTYTYRTLCIHLKLMLSPPSSFISKRENKIKMIWCGWWVNGRSVLCFGKWARFLFFFLFLFLCVLILSFHFISTKFHKELSRPYSFSRPAIL